MRGHTHALSAGVAWLATAPYISRHFHAMPPVTVAEGFLVAVGAGLAPDLDHHNGTIAHMFGPISKGLCKVVATISGGHRHATHSLVGAGVFLLLAMGATHHLWGLVALLWVCTGLAVRSLWGPPRNRRDGRLDWRDVAGLLHAASALAVAWWLATRVDAGMVPWAFGAGYLTHLVGDSLTERGVPWLWPKPRCYRVASIDTGKSVEEWVIVPALYVVLIATVYLTHGSWAPALVETFSGG